MGFLARCTILVLGVGLTARIGAAAQTDQEPRYDPATVVTMRVIVAEVKEVAIGNALPGIHLMVRQETSHADAERTDVYVGPTAFLKDMGLAFAINDRMDVSGSKVKVGNGAVILAREVRRNTSTLYIRDQKGEPIWKVLAAVKD